MKPLLLFAFLPFALAVHAEGFLNFPGETHSIDIKPDEAIIITSLFDAQLDASWPTYAFGGQTYFLGWRTGAIFAGPAQLTTTNKCSVSYQRFSAPYLRTLIWTNYCTNNIKFHLSVPAGKTLRFLCALDNNPVNIYAARPGNTNLINFLQKTYNPIFDPADNLDLVGPVELELSTPSCNAFRNYYFVEDAAEATADGYLLGPAGTYQVAVEKSLDLKAWSPLMLKSTESSDARAFYRLRITK